MKSLFRSVAVVFVTISAFSSSKTSAKLRGQQSALERRRRRFLMTSLAQNVGGAGGQNMVMKISTRSPTRAPTTQDTLTTFCVFADVPYNDEEAEPLETAIQTLPEDCEFLVHLGDIKSGSSDCTRDKYTTVDDILQQSPVPTFMMLGDNEWNDCSPLPQGPVQGLLYWNQYFLKYDEKHWDNSPFQVTRQAFHEENFFMLRKQTLFIGVGNLVGGRVLSTTEWEDRLESNLKWVKELIESNVPSRASGVVLLGHSALEIEVNNDNFFQPLADYIRDFVDDNYPVLYLHGDGHGWIHTPNFYSISNYLRIQAKAGPALLVMSVDTATYNDPVDAFQYCRTDKPNCR